MEHYAEAFCLLSERCFRFIHAENGTGHAQHCPFITEWRGRFKDAAGKWHTVEACSGHRADLDSVQRVGSPSAPGSLFLEVAKPEHDSCPQCGSVEIGTSFNRSDSSGVPKWDCHCTDCRFRWSEKSTS